MATCGTESGIIIASREISAAAMLMILFLVTFSSSLLVDSTGCYWVMVICCALRVFGSYRTVTILPGCRSEELPVVPSGRIIVVPVAISSVISPEAVVMVIVTPEKLLIAPLTSLKVGTVVVVGGAVVCVVVNGGVVAVVVAVGGVVEVVVGADVQAAAASSAAISSAT